jgi:hypothetical protein
VLISKRLHRGGGCRGELGQVAPRLALTSAGCCTGASPWGGGLEQRAHAPPKPHKELAIQLCALEAGRPTSGLIAPKPRSSFRGSHAHGLHAPCACGMWVWMCDDTNTKAQAAVSRQQLQGPRPGGCHSLGLRASARTRTTCPTTEAIPAARHCCCPRCLQTTEAI